MSVTVHPQRCHAVPLGKGGMFLSSLGGVPEKPWVETRRLPASPLGQGGAVPLACGQPGNWDPRTLITCLLGLAFLKAHLY